VSPSTSMRNSKAILLSVMVVLLFTGTGIAGKVWWDEHNRPSQASKTDCVLAQQLVDSAQKIAGDRAAVAKWEKDERQRRAQIDDGYLGANISVYDGWAALRAKGEGTVPTGEEVLRLSDKANAHCSDARVTLTFPPLAS